MPKYLICSSYTQEGLKGLLKDGGTKRMQSAKRATESLGGTLEAFYFAYGDNDLYIIVDQPDNVNVIGGILLGKVVTTELLKEDLAGQT